MNDLVEIISLRRDEDGRILTGEDGRPLTDRIIRQETAAEVAARQAEAAQRVVEPAEVDAERDRRIDAGFTFNGAAFQSRLSDRENIAGAAQLAFMAMMSGSGAVGDVMWNGTGRAFEWIGADNSLIQMDAPAVVDLGRAAAQHKQAHIFAARSLKDLDPIPHGFADDVHWPQI
jgi:hypothetical protein